MILFLRRTHEMTIIKSFFFPPSDYKEKKEACVFFSGKKHWENYTPNYSRFWPHKDGRIPSFRLQCATVHCSVPSWFKACQVWSKITAASMLISCHCSRAATSSIKAPLKINWKTCFVIGWTKANTCLGGCHCKACALFPFFSRG